MGAANRRVVVDLAALLRASSGGGAVRRRWHDGVGRLGPLHVRARESAFPPRTTAIDDVMRLATAMAKVSGPVAVIGQPGALDAIRVWTCAPSAPSALRFLSRRDHVTEKRAVALLGPAWIERAVDDAVLAGARVAVCGMPSAEEVEPPPKGWWLGDPLAGDGRCGVLGSAVLLAAALGGVDVEEAWAGAMETAVAVDGPAGVDNPGWSLARGLRLAQTELGRDSVVHLAGDPRLTGLARWAARAQASTLIGGGNHAMRDRAAPACAEAGDEEWIEALTVGPRDRLVLQWQADDDAEASEAAARVLADAGQIVITLRLPGCDPRSIGAAVSLWLRAMACLALLEERTPGPLRSVAGWHAALDGDPGA